jgi:hypothetical protein
MSNYDPYDDPYADSRSGGWGATREQTTECPGCFGSGTITIITEGRFGTPSAYHWELDGVVPHREENRVTCLRCGGRGEVPC